MIRSSGSETLTEKYSKEGLVPKADIDPELMKAFQNAKGNGAAIRPMMYYRMATPNQTPGTLRTDVRDCIFRFKIARDAFSEIERITTDGGKNPLFNGSTSNKKSALSREEVLKRLLTGRAFCFKFEIENEVKGISARAETITIFVTPEKLFNLYIDRNYRHSTMFRHSKYTYSISKSKIEEKWFYPMDYGHDTRLRAWNIQTEPITKWIKVYLVDPNDGNSKDVTETYTVTYVTSNEAGANISGKIADIITLGVNGKLNSSTTSKKEVVTKYKINYKNMEIGEFSYNFFEDEPIHELTSDGKFILPVRKGQSFIETSVLPVSTSFFTSKRYQ